MNSRSRYKEVILRTVTVAKATPHWSRSDYLEPIRKLYLESTPKNRMQMQQALLELLSQNEELDSLIDVSQELRLKKACKRLLGLFLNPPKYSTEGRRLWVDGFRRQILVAIGQIRCTEARSFVESLLENATHRTRHSDLPRLSIDCYGVTLCTLTRLAPERASQFFGWWLEKDQMQQRKLSTIVRTAEGYQELSAAGLGHLLDSEKSFAVQNCILAVAERGGLSGLRRWLKSVSLHREASRVYLRNQLTHMLTRRDPLGDLRTLLTLKDDPVALASHLASLPSLTEAGEFR